MTTPPSDQGTAGGAARAVYQEYARRLALRQAKWAAAERRHLWLSRTRLALIACFIVLGILVGMHAFWVYALPAVAFVGAAVIHARILADRTIQARARAYYQRGIDRLEHRWIGRGDEGERYRPKVHPYADDLDLFGAGSLFELIGTAHTEPGQDTIASWMLQAASPAEVLARQAAVKELAPRLDLREALALDADAASADRLATLRAWVSGPRTLSARIRVALAATAAAIAIVGAWWLLTQSLPRPLAWFLLAVACVQAGLLMQIHRRVQAVLNAMNLPIGQLTLLSGILRTMERTRFSEPRLVHLQQALGGTDRRASAEIAHLRQLVALLESRNNIFFAIPAAAVAWAAQLACAIDGWRARVGPHVVRWIDAVGEFEALAVMGTYAAEHPAHAFPTFVPSPARVKAARLAHPLLPDSAVGNDLAIGADAPHVLIVSGSNMSGKSTLLRALGSNIVLAQMGLPVRASSFEQSPLVVGASIRVLDSLHEGRSRFFAEVSRLALIVNLARDQRGRVLFLLDEILGGTNSYDRLHGAEGVVSGLIAFGAIGLMTTHDLALGDIVTRLSAPGTNVHFADEFDGGGLHFDYRLRPGIVQTRNALALMRAVGLDIPG